MTIRFLLSGAVLRRGLLTGAALATSVVLSACGGGSGSSAPDHGGMTMAPSSASASAAGFNDADVAFAQAMVPHHRQAVEMASLAAGRAAGSGVKELAAKIKSAQQPEIDTMNGWLAAWGEPTAMAGMDHSSMPGMMTGTAMANLRNAKGAAFDRQFLTMMISHHQGAIEMARQEGAKGSNPDAVALAKKIIADQQAEIATMRAMLAKV